MNSSALVNAHTHLYSGLMSFGPPPPPADAPAPASLLDILRQLWWRLDRALDGEILAAAARFALAEGRALGTRALLDHHESPSFIDGSLDVLGDACQELGVAAVLCYGVTERNGGREEALAGLSECRRFIAANRRPLVRGVVGVHASFTVSDETLRDAGRLARKLGTVVHIHVAEDRCDVEDARGRGYEGVIDRLVQTDALPPGSILAHGVHLNPSEVKEVMARGWWLVQNPRSNAGNKVGYPGALQYSVRVALGTDGYPADMLVELEELVRQGTARGDDPLRVAARLPAGRRLMAERFGGEDVLAVPGWPPSPTSEAQDRIRAQAEAAAARLWKRMSS